MKTVDDLRDHLFDTLASLRDEKNPLDIERAKAIADVAQTIINSAKVEVEYLRVTEGGGSGFLDGKGKAEKLPAGIVGIRQHRIAG